MLSVSQLLGSVVQKFREGVELIKFCRGELKGAENEFQKLKKELETEEQ